MIDNQLILQIQKALSKESKIKLAYVLGSIVSGRTRKDSDFDLAIVVEDSKQLRYENIFILLSGISFPKDLDLSIIDKSSSPLFLFQITATGKCVYQIFDEERISFEAYVLKNYYDTAHLRGIYYSYLKDKFPYASQ